MRPAARVCAAGQVQTVTWKRVTTLCLEATGQRAGSVHLAERLCSFSSSTHRAFHGERAGKNDRGGLGDRCEIRSARTRHHTNCSKQGNVKRAQGCRPWSPPQGGARDQSASARRGLPSRREARALHHQPRPSIDLDHALPHVHAREQCMPAGHTSTGFRTFFLQPISSVQESLTAT